MLQCDNQIPDVTMSMGANSTMRWRTGSGDAAQSLSECRAAVLRSLFPKLAPWRETSAERHERARIEALLFSADSVDELHRRIELLPQIEPAGAALLTVHHRTLRKTLVDVAQASKA
jgi:hypothetical protein